MRSSARWKHSIAFRQLFWRCVIQSYNKCFKTVIWYPACVWLSAIWANLSFWTKRIESSCIVHNKVYVLFLRFRRTFFKTLMQEIQEVEAEHVSASLLRRNPGFCLCLHWPSSSVSFCFLCNALLCCAQYSGESFTSHITSFQLYFITHKHLVFLGNGTCMKILYKNWSTKLNYN